MLCRKSLEEILFFHHFNAILDRMDINFFQMVRVSFISVDFATRVTFGKHLRR